MLDDTNSLDGAQIMYQKNIKQILCMMLLAACYKTELCFGDVSELDQQSALVFLIGQRHWPWSV